MFVIAQLSMIVISYAVLFVAVPWFFKQSHVAITKRSLWSIVSIILLIAGISLIIFNVQSEFWGNRIQHCFAGGFLMTFVLFRVIKDTGVRLDPVRFFLMSGMLVTTLGVTSEMLEFFLQTTTHLVFAESINDTWWDLLSNAVGATIGGLLFAPFIPLEITNSSAQQSK